MKPHELLRQAALILADGWSHNTNARQRRSYSPGPALEESVTQHETDGTV